MTRATSSAIFLLGSMALITSIDVSTRFYFPRKSRPRARAKILVKLCSRSFSSFSNKIWVMLSTASCSHEPQKIKPIAREAIAYSSTLLSLSTIKGDMISSKSNLALPA